MLALQRSLDVAVEPFDHAVGLRRSWWGQPGFNTGGKAKRIKRVLSCCVAPAHPEKAVSERLAIIGLNCFDTDLTCPFQIA